MQALPGLKSQPFIVSLGCCGRCRHDVGNGHNDLKFKLVKVFLRFDSEALNASFDEILSR